MPVSRSRRLGRLAALGLAAASSIGGLAACQPTPGTPPVPPPSTTTTTRPPASTPCSSGSTAIVCSQVQVGGLTRKFFTHVSPSAAPAGGRPLVFWFHGDGGSGNVNLASLYAQTDPDGAVVIQMDGPNNIASLGRGGTAWSFSMNGSSPDDVGFTKRVIDGVLDGSLVPGAGVNPKRIYAVGASRGGFMVDTLAVDVRTAGRFAAVTSLMGNFYCEDGDAVCEARVAGAGFDTKAAVLHIHGDSDGVVDPPAHLPNPVTATISWPWPLGQMSDAHGCSGDYAYGGQLANIGGQATYLYKPAGGCATDFRLVLIKGVGHGFGGWEPYTWSFLKAKSLP